MSPMPLSRRSIYPAHVSTSFASGYKPGHAGSFLYSHFWTLSSENGLNPSRIWLFQRDAQPFAFWWAYYPASMPLSHPGDQFHPDAPNAISCAVAYFLCTVVSGHRLCRSWCPKSTSLLLTPFRSLRTGMSVLYWQDKYKHPYRHRI